MLYVRSDFGRGKVVDSISTSDDIAVDEVHRRASVVFSGEKMVCILCGREEISDPAKNTDWRAASVPAGEIDLTFYACIDHFPPDGATKLAFKNAYTRFMGAIKKRMRDTRYVYREILRKTLPPLLNQMWDSLQRVPFDERCKVMREGIGDRVQKEGKVRLGIEFGIVGLPTFLKFLDEFIESKRPV